MKNCKLLNLKNMKETIVNYSGDQKEFDKIWDSFYDMTWFGFISYDTWGKFIDHCAGCWCVWHCISPLFRVKFKIRIYSGKNVFLAVFQGGKNEKR